MSEVLTIEQVKTEAMKNYNNGGDVVIECWEDKDIQAWIDGTEHKCSKPNKTIKDLYKLFALYKDTENE